MRVRNTSRGAIGLAAPPHKTVLCPPGQVTEVPDEVIEALKDCPVTLARFNMGDLVDEDVAVADAKARAEAEAKAKADAKAKESEKGGGGKK